MLFSDNSKISFGQLAAILFLAAFSSGMLFLPRLLVEQVGQSAPLWAVFMGTLSGIWAVALTLLCRGTPFFVLLQFTFGRKIGRILAILIGLRLFFVAALEIRFTAEATQQILLPQTPIWALSGVLVLLAWIFARTELEGVARAAEICGMVVFLFFIFTFLFAAAQALPMGQMPDWPQQMPRSRALVLFPSLLLLFFLPGRTVSVSKRGLFFLYLAVGIALSAICWLCLAFFGTMGTAGRLLPTISALGRVSGTGLFLSGTEGLLLFVWMSGSMFFSGLCLHFGTRLFWGGSRGAILSAGLVWVIAALTQKNGFLLQDTWCGPLDLLLLIGLPLLLWIFRKKEDCQ